MEKIIRKTIRGKHIYKFKGTEQEHVGITSMLGIINKPWITKWKLNNPDWEEKFKKAGKVGNLVHKYCEMRSYLKKDEINTSFMENLKLNSDYEVTNCINAFESFMDSYKPTILFAEIKCINRSTDVGSYGCTIDAVLKIEDRLFVADYKTSSSVSKEHKIQAVMCAKAFVQHVHPGDFPIPTVIHLNKKSGKFRYIPIENWDRYFKAGASLVEFYNLYGSVK